MVVNKPVAGITVVGLLGLALIFMFDPTHDYPTISVAISLDPDENTTMRIPTMSSGFMEWAGTLIGSPHLWVKTDADTEGLILVDFLKTLKPSVEYGFDIANFTVNGTITIANLGNDTVSAIITCTIAPPPDVLGKAKTWWYIVLAFVQTLSSGGLALFNGQANIFNNKGQKVASTSTTASAAAKPCATRTCLSWTFNLFCNWGSSPTAKPISLQMSKV